MPGNLELSSHLFLQLAIILLVSRAVGHLLRHVGQTQVVGEMVAGILLGPSLLGFVAPRVQTWLFPSTLPLTIGNAVSVVPHPSMLILYALGQLGLILYMFLMGLDFNTSLISRHFREASIISLSGVIVPVILGGYLGFTMDTHAGLFTASMQPWQAGIFLASAMSVTAFPVLARIIYDKGVTKTKIGTLALGAAATTDAIAWCLLAIVLATASHSFGVAVLAIGGGLAYTAFMFLAGRRFFARFELLTSVHREIPIGGLVTVLAILLVCASLTDAIGIHSIFGAFIAGVVMPRGRFAAELLRTVERVTVVLLVPIFFVYSGLNTRLDLLFQGDALYIAGIVVFVAFLAKGGAVFTASWLSGSGWRSSAAIGALMNARGLMELILINVGLDRGLITPTMFTILVVMTIVTTMVAAPAFQLLYRPTGGEAGVENATLDGRLSNVG